MGRMEDQHAAIENSSLDIEKLKAEEAYGLNESAWFFSKRDSFWELSNMAGAMPIVFEGQRCNSSEQLYQASKYGPDVECVPASNPDAEPNVRKRILAQKAAKGSKMTQKCANNARLFREDWEDGGYLIGSNVLGKLLTLLRDEKYEKARNRQFTYPGGFLL